MRSRESEIDRFLWCLAIGPLLVILALAVEQFLPPLLGSQISVDTARSKALATVFHFTALLLALAGSVLALFGAIRLSEWAKLPSHNRRNRIRPRLKAIWMLAIAETSVLLLVSIIWIGL